MGDCEGSGTVAVPPARLFTYLADVRNLPAFLPRGWADEAGPGQRGRPEGQRPLWGGRHRSGGQGEPGQTVRIGEDVECGDAAVPDGERHDGQWSSLGEREDAGCAVDQHQTRVRRETGEGDRLGLTNFFNRINTTIEEPAGTTW
ncbi:hypothetical protein [Kitasatospora paranensis]|uniref:Coenzyme Q-binding protein COQ10 START domain-containing protein n=1 Tax=Kitasatospora paranensis TaxID=258053 RepID=A0ABW2FW27_9ACTN